MKSGSDFIFCVQKVSRRKGIVLRKMIIGLCLCGVCLIYAQDYDINNAHDMTADTVVNNGWMIMYGRLIEKPFHLYIENDTFWINGMQYMPSPPDPFQKPPAYIPEYTELGWWYFKTNEIFLDSCQTKHLRWLQEFDMQESLDCLLTYINTQDLIKIKSVSGHTGGIKIVYDYQWGDLNNNLPVPEMEQENPSIIKLLPHKDEVEHILKKQNETEKMYIGDLNTIKRILMRGAFAYIPYSGGIDELGRVYGREQEFIDNIKRILRESASDEEAKAEFEQLDISSPESDHIIRNKNYWLDE